jgi:hypothetical protein
MYLGQDIMVVGVLAEELLHLMEDRKQKKKECRKGPG